MRAVFAYGGRRAARSAGRRRRSGSVTIAEVVVNGRRGPLGHPAPGPALRGAVACAGRAASRSRPWRSSASASARRPQRSASPISSCCGRCRFPMPAGSSSCGRRTPGYSRMELSPPNYRDWKAASTVFEGIGAFWAIAANLSVTASRSASKARPLRPTSCRCSACLPLLGRVFTDADGSGGARWERRAELPFLARRVSAVTPHVLGGRSASTIARALSSA